MSKKMRLPSLTYRDKKKVRKKRKRSKLKFFQEAIEQNPRHEFKRQIEQYIESHYANEPDNTPEIIEKRLREFHPELNKLFDNLEAVL